MIECKRRKWLVGRRTGGKSAQVVMEEQMIKRTPVNTKRRSQMLQNNCVRINQGVVIARR